jgi:predicted nucleic acid-binding Zn ribbon protein
MCLVCRGFVPLTTRNHVPTYIYETVPTQPDEAVERFELRQSMNEPALTVHPRTGAPVHRVVSGGMGFLGAPRHHGAPLAGPACQSGPACGCGW